MSNKFAWSFCKCWIICTRFTRKKDAMRMSPRNRPFLTQPLERQRWNETLFAPTYSHGIFVDSGKDKAPLPARTDSSTRISQVLRVRRFQRKIAPKNPSQRPLPPTLSPERSTVRIPTLPWPPTADQLLRKRADGDPFATLTHSITPAPDGAKLR